MSLHLGTFGNNCCFVAGTSLEVDLKNEHTLPNYFVVLLLVPLGLPLHWYLQKKMLFCCWNLFRRQPKKQTYPSEIFCCFVAGTTKMCHCIGTFGKNCCFVAGTSLGVSLKNEHTLPKYFVVLLLVPFGRATA
jgi:hypothetical protein